jgi:hypothetical protein
VGFFQDRRYQSGSRFRALWSEGAVTARAQRGPTSLGGEGKRARAKVCRRIFAQPVGHCDHSRGGMDGWPDGWKSRQGPKEAVRRIIMLGGHRLTATIEGLRSWGELDRGRGGGAGVFGEFQRESSEKGRGLTGRRRRAVRGVRPPMPFSGRSGRSDGKDTRHPCLDGCG